MFTKKPSILTIIFILCIHIPSLDSFSFNDQVYKSHFAFDICDINLESSNTCVHPSKCITYRSSQLLACGYDHPDCLCVPPELTKCTSSKRCPLGERCVRFKAFPPFCASCIAARVLPPFKPLDHRSSQECASVSPTPSPSTSPSDSDSWITRTEFDQYHPMSVLDAQVPSSHVMSDQDSPSSKPSPTPTTVEKLRYTGESCSTSSQCAPSRWCVHIAYPLLSCDRQDSSCMCRNRTWKGCFNSDECVEHEYCANTYVKAENRTYPHVCWTKEDGRYGELTRTVLNGTHWSPGYDGPASRLWLDSQSQSYGWSNTSEKFGSIAGLSAEAYDSKTATVDIVASPSPSRMPQASDFDHRSLDGLSYSTCGTYIDDYMLCKGQRTCLNMFDMDYSSLCGETSPVCHCIPHRTTECTSSDDCGELGEVCARPSNSTKSYCISHRTIEGNALFAIIGSNITSSPEVTEVMEESMTASPEVPKRLGLTLEECTYDSECVGERRCFIFDVFYASRRKMCIPQVGISCTKDEHCTDGERCNSNTDFTAGFCVSPLVVEDERQLYHGINVNSFHIKWRQGPDDDEPPSPKARGDEPGLTGDVCSKNKDCFGRRSCINSFNVEQECENVSGRKLCFCLLTGAKLRVCQLAIHCADGEVCPIAGKRFSHDDRVFSFKSIYGRNTPFCMSRRAARRNSIVVMPPRNVAMNVVEQLRWARAIEIAQYLSTEKEEMRPIQNL